MKYFFVLLIATFFITSCSDGDLITETFNFKNTTVQKCTTTNTTSTTLYKINDSEALVVTLADINFANTVSNTPASIAIDGVSTTVIYKKYAANASTASVCETANTQITEQWNAIGGNIEITTTPILETNTNKIVAYNHQIVFKNITFAAPNKNVIYTNYDFGNYRTEVTDLKFDYTQSTIQKCTNTNLLFKYAGNTALLLDCNWNSLLKNEVTAVNMPRTALIDGTNKAVYRVYNGSLNANYFCATINPSSPILAEEWVADPGVANTSGIIKVITTATTNPNVFKHTIVLYKVTFRKGVLYYTPNLDTEYIFGDYYTSL